MNIIAISALVLGIFLVFKADKLGGSSAILYAIAGMGAALWAIMNIMAGPASIKFTMPMFLFAGFGIVTFYTRGALSAISGALALIIFLSFVF